MGRSIKGHLTRCISNNIRCCNVTGLDSLYTLFFVHNCLNIGGKPMLKPLTCVETCNKLHYYEPTSAT